MTSFQRAKKTDDRKRFSNVETAYCYISFDDRSIRSKCSDVQYLSEIESLDVNVDYRKPSLSSASQFY